MTEPAEFDEIVSAFCRSMMWCEMPPSRPYQHQTYIGSTVGSGWALTICVTPAASSAVVMSASPLSIGGGSTHVGSCDYRALDPVGYG